MKPSPVPSRAVVSTVAPAARSHAPTALPMPFVPPGTGARLPSTWPIPFSPSVACKAGTKRASKLSGNRDSRPDLQSHDPIVLHPERKGERDGTAGKLASHFRANLVRIVLRIQL